MRIALACGCSQRALRRRSERTHGGGSGRRPNGGWFTLITHLAMALWDWQCRFDAAGGSWNHADGTSAPDLFEPGIAEFHRGGRVRMTGVDAVDPILQRATTRH